MLVQNRFEELLARKQRLEGRSITRRQVALETGLSVTSVQNWASNSVKRFDELQIVVFCRYFGCGIAELLVLENESPEMKAPLAAA